MARPAPSFEAMPDDTRKPSLLESLRAESAAIREQQTHSRPLEELFVEMDRRLWRAYRWLDEALAHLEVIRPTVAHEFRADALVTLSGLSFDRGFATYRRKHIGGQDLLQYVEMMYRMVGKTPLNLRVPLSAAPGIENRMRTLSLPFSWQADQASERAATHGTFTVTPAVSSSVRFDPDYRRQKFTVRLSNVDRFESVSLEFGAEALDEPVLEDMRRFVTGESNTFLRRAKLTGIEGGRRAQALPEPEIYRVEKTVRLR